MIVAVFNLWQLILKGGPMMWPLILLSIAALAVAMEKIVYLSSIEKVWRVHKGKVFQSLQKESIQQTLSLCESLKNPFGRIIKAGLLKFGNASDVIKTAMEEAFLYESYRLKERMSILNFVMNVSALIGLLGTVIGLTTVFHSIQVRSNVLNPLSVGDVSVGIWQALFSTVLGLMVCILSFSAYSFCASQINNLIADLQITMAKALQVLAQRDQLNESPQR